MRSRGLLMFFGFLVMIISVFALLQANNTGVTGAAVFGDKTEFIKFFPTLSMNFYFTLLLVLGIIALILGTKQKTIH